MKKLLGIIVFSLLGLNFTYAENITILCKDEKRSKDENRDVHLTLNFDEGGDWIKFGNKKFVNGTKSVDGKVTELTEIKINSDEIGYFYNNFPAKIYMIMKINRFDGSMFQTGKIADDVYNYSYQCEKTQRKF